jgi:RNA polymerase sigma factor (sigma-70 family)
MVSSATPKTSPKKKRIRRSGSGEFRFVNHSSLSRPNAEKRYLSAEVMEILVQDGRLSVSEETRLFEALHASGYLATKELKSKGTETKRLQRLRTLRNEVRQRLVDANLGLVYELVRRSRFTNVDNDDLVSDGLYALLQAVDAFNPWKGYRFSTYACNAILRSFIRRSMSETKRRMRAPVSFDPLMENGDSLSEQRLNETNLYAERLSKLIDEGAVEINETERFVLAKRFPMSHSRKRATLEEIGRAISVSKERVRQIQNGALQKLREAMEADPVLQ